MKTSSVGNVPFPCPSPRPLTKATPDTDAHSPRSFSAERQAHRQAEWVHKEELRQRRARIQAANEAMSTYLRESGTRNYQQAFGYIQRARPELFARMQVPADLAAVESPRHARILAANDAVSAYLRESGTTNYQAAFNHILRARPELFAGLQDPSGAVAAANFNPCHDQRGRFATSSGAEGRRNDVLDGQGGGETKPASIRDYQYDSSNAPLCAVAAVQSMIATMRASTNNSKPVPDRDATEKQFNAAARRTIDWSKGLDTPFNDHGATFASIMQNVLAQNGVPSHARFNYPSAKVLADEIIAADVPVIANIITADRGATVYEHAIIIQWDKDNKRFLVNNIDAQGHTTSYSQKTFESGELRVDTESTGVHRFFDARIDLHNAVIFAKKP